MKPQIKYAVDRRRKEPITPHIMVGDMELVATAPMTLAEAQHFCRLLVADGHPIDEQYTKKYHEDVNCDDLMREIRSYDE